jgi:hypothetical protein
MWKTLVLSLAVMTVGAAVASASIGGPLRLGALKACIQLHGGLADTTGIRSTAFSFGVDQDPQVGAVIVVSERNPKPSIPTRILITGRRPVLTKFFANARIDAYVFHRRSVTPLPGAMSAARRMVGSVTAACVAAAR